MNVPARREDVFALPVLVTVRGWYGRPLLQVRCGLKALRAPRRKPSPANDQ